MGKSDQMQSFWDEKARENAMYYVSSYRDYGQEDEAEFDLWGRRLAGQFLAEAGIDPSPSAVVAEIGCGIGRMTAYFAEHFGRVVALDISPEMLERARKRLKDPPNVEFRAASGRGLAGVEERSVDLVFSYIVLQHIPDAEVALDYLRDAGRVLRSGGHLLVQFNNTEIPTSGLGLRRRLRALRDRFARNGPRGLTHPAWIGSRLTTDQVREACAAGGLTELEFRGEGSQYCWVQSRRD